MTADYLQLFRTAPRRLATLRRMAAEYNAKPYNQEGTPRTWRNMRTSTYVSADNTYSPGLEGGAPCWYGHTDPYARFVWADEVPDVGGIAHVGWYQDPNGDIGVIRGFIIQWPHGRIQAGYQDTEGGGFTYLSGLYDSVRDAAYAADDAARRAAEAERDYRYQEAEARALLDDIDGHKERLRECLVLRNHPCFERVRGEIQDIVAKIRKARDTLDRDYADIYPNL